MKYGAFSNALGSIEIAWTIAHRADGDRLVFRWREKNGPIVTPPTRKRFGSRVIERGLMHELSAQGVLDYRPNGLVCTVDARAAA